MGLAFVVTVGPYEVILATWNGATFLDQQIASIMAQTIQPIRIVAADDGSIDRSLSILERWRQRNIVPIEILPPNCSRLGSCAAFERLLNHTSAEYVMPSDQDDIWERDKAERLLRYMFELEHVHGSRCPLLVHSDLSLMGSTGAQLGSSFHCFQGLQPHSGDWLEIALQNVVSGCACVVNRACVEQALPFPPEAVLHDWWLALVASCAGALAYLPQPTVRYRLHGTNAVGALGWRRQLIRRLSQAFTADALDGWIGTPLRQLKACASRFKGSPESDGTIFVEQLFHLSPWKRCQAAIALHLHKHGLWRTFGFYVGLMLWRPDAHSHETAL